MHCRFVALERFDGEEKKLICRIIRRSLHATLLTLLAGLFAFTAQAQITIPSAGNIGTVAGSGSYGYSGDGGSALSADITNPFGVAVDSAGNIYIADGNNSVIRKVTASTGIITTIAGNGTGGYSGDGGLATGAELSLPLGLAIDSARNLYIVDSGNAVIRKVAASTGIITTVAGNGTWGYSGDGGPATSAQLNSVVDVAVDSVGNLYIADMSDMVVRMVSAATGIITTVAGNGTTGYSGDGGPATSAQLNEPRGVNVDAAGNLYIEEQGNNVIRKVLVATGVITTIAGNGTAGYSGDGGPATSAELNLPVHGAFDAAGNLFFTDFSNNVIREITATGTITTVAGNGTAGYLGDGGSATSAELYEPYGVTVDAAGDIYIADYANCVIRVVGSTVSEPVRTTPTITWSNPAAISYGTALSGAQLNATANVPGTFTYYPASGVQLPAGLQSLSVLFTPTDTTHYSVAIATTSLTVNQATPSITWSTPAPIVYGVALSTTQLNATANVPGTFTYTPGLGAVLLPGPQNLSVTFTPTDTTDYAIANASVRLMVSGIPGPGIITTVAGDGIYGYSGDGGPALSAEMEDVQGAAVDSAGNIYIADTSTSVVRKVTASTGVITTFAGTGTQGYSGDGGPAAGAQLSSPVGVAVDSAGNVYIADANNNRIRKVAASTGIISTIAGTGIAGFSGDGGSAANAELSYPDGVAIDGSGTIYIADSNNDRVRMISASTGNIATVAGTGSNTLSGDGGPATSAGIGSIYGLGIDSAGNLYLADFEDSVIRKVTASTGIISTITGNGTAGYTGDGSAATSAEVNGPAGIAVDGEGNIYFADLWNHVVREISSSTGIISTIAGNGTAGYTGDGGPATSAEMNFPNGIAVDASADVYIADCGAEVVRLVGGSSEVKTTTTLSWPTPASITYGTPLSGTQLDATANVQGTFVYSLDAGTVLSAGSHTLSVTFTPTDAVDFTSATAHVTLIVRPATLTVTANNIDVTTDAAIPQLTDTITGFVNGDSSNVLGGAPALTTTATASSPAGSYPITVTIGTLAAANYQFTFVNGTLTISSATCTSNGYSYRRVVTVDHTKVANTDQANFPLLFNVTDRLLASTANGGQVANSNGYDIIFSSDPTGQTKLDFEIEEYDPVRGQLIAWVRIPTLSHTTDTTFYMFYGNSTVTTPQQNPSGVWDSNYVGVWHLPNDGTLSANDSTANENNGAFGTGITATPAFIDGGAVFNASETGGTGISLPTSAGIWNFPGDLTLSTWIKTTGNRLMAIQLQSSNSLAYLSVGSTTESGAENDAVVYLITPTGGLVIASGNTPINDGQWHNIQAVRSAGNSVLIYVDGVLETSTPYTDAGPVSDSGGVAVIGGGGANFAYNGLIDETRISNVARSSDWIATEYANQRSPATFYSMSSENFSVSPQAVTLYGQQSLTFTAMAYGVCNASVQWTASPSDLGTLTQNGVYTAPASISSPQTVTITATNTSGPGTASATVSLIPAPSQPTLTLDAEIQPPYVVGASQTFVGTFKNLDGTPVQSVPVTFTVTGANSSLGTATTDDNGVALFTYTGGSAGIDTIQAAGSAGGAQTTSNKVSAVWIVPAQPISTTTVTGLFFTYDGSGNFDRTPADKPAFTQTFPTLIFNPEQGTVSGNTSGVDNTTLPFTNIVTDAHGNFAGTIVAQGNGYQAGCDTTTGPPCTTLLGNMFNFQAVFSGSFVVKSAGNVTFTYYDDDLFILGIGNGATGVSGPTTNFAPSRTPFLHFPTMGSNLLSINSAQPIVVNFPAPGTYPFEIDYAQSAGGPLGLYITAGASSSGIAPTASITLSPGSEGPQPAGGTLPFTATAIDASGNPVTNLNVDLTVTFADNLNLIATTNASGVATFNYQNQKSGNAVVQATALIDGMVAYSNTVNVPWTLPPANANGPGGSNTLSIDISAPDEVVLPNPLQLTGTATDSGLPSGQTPSVSWSELSGPGTVTFANSQQTATSATFSMAGTYVLKLSATDALNSGSAQIQVIVEPTPPVTQGWIGSPANGTQVNGLVPITVSSGVALQSGTLGYYPANNPSNVTVLNSNTNTSGSSQIGTLDTTKLANGSYWISLVATDTSGNTQYSLALVTVTGNYKPGRVTSTVTDLVVPSTGLAINIKRTYDSLNAGTSSDFGFGWSLGINVNLVVDNKGNVTLTLGGQRRTFFLTPEPVPCSPLVGCLFPWLETPAWTPEPGLHGSLAASGSGCPDGWDVLTADGECQTGGFYNPPGYIYTDPTGTQYTISATGGLQSIDDRNGNGLTISPSGITSTTGLSVPFIRDSQNRITQITDPQGNVYSYGYDANGNLASVTYPQTTNSQTCSGANASNTSQYNYYPDSEHPNYPSHFYAGGTDGRCNPLPVTTYYDSTNDDGDSSLDGRLASVTDALNNTTSYAYTLSTTSTINGVAVLNTGVTTITYPKDANGNTGTATMIYDSLGDVLSSTDPLNHITTNTYDANQNLLSTTDPLNHTTSYTYDANGNKTSTTYPATATSTNTTSYTNYNQYSEPTSTTDELGNVRTFNYDDNFNPASVTDSLGTLMSTSFNPDGTMASGAIGFDITQNPSRASQLTYDGNGNLASKTDALGRTTSYTYNSLGQKISMTLPVPSGSSAAAATTGYTYDPFGNLTQTSAPLGRVTSSQYDDNGNKISDTDANGNVTRYKYDALNRLVETDYPDQTKKTVDLYDFRNNVIHETDQNGNVTLHQYDLAGRQISVTQASGTANATTTSFGYDDAGRKTSETDALSHITGYTYDAAGNLLSISGPKGNFSYTYDNARNQTSMTDGENNVTQYQYDARKRLTMTTYPATTNQPQTTKTNAYDGPGNLVSVTDQAGNQVQYTYDAANQLVSVIQVNSPNTDANTTIYGYDANGNPIALEDANTHTTSQIFDVLSELTSKTLPDGQLTESRTYDSNGNLQTVTHFNGTATTYAYDKLNRLLSRITPGEATVSYTYTPTGKYLTSTDASGTTTYTYDSMDRLTAKATPEGTLNYTYDAAGHVASIASSHVNGASMSYTYDSLNRLSTVVDNRITGSNTTTYTYDNANNVLTETYPNGVQAVLQYDTLNRVSGLGYSNQTGVYTYLRDQTGNLTTASEPSGRQMAWSYDGIYRLTGETISLAPSHNNGSVSYGLDPVGNRSSESSSLPDIPSGSFNFNADDELSSESYDPNGNVTASGGKTFAYDSQNQMLSMTASGTAVSMVYDAFGDRVGKSVNGVVTRYLVDDLNPTGYPQVMEELNGAGTVTRTYTYGLQRIDEEQILNGAWTPSFYGYDGGGSVRQLTNTAGAITDSYEYDAFGNEFTVSGSTPNEMMYRGEQYDSDLGLYYLRARYYNPATGRFMSIDPGADDCDDDDDDGVCDFVDTDGNDLASPATLHKYLYTGSDPVNWLDPTGQASTSAAGGSLGEYAPLAGLALLVAYEGTVLHPTQPTHVDFSSLQALGINISCTIYSEGSKLGAELDSVISGGGEVFQAGPCTYSYRPHRGGKNKGKHQAGERQKGMSRGPQTHPKSPPRKPPSFGGQKWKGRWPPPKWAPPMPPGWTNPYPWWPKAPPVE